MKKLFASMIVFSSMTAFAAPTVKTWINPDCQTGQCEVKAMRLYINKSVDTRNAYTQMVAEIEGATGEDLKKYAVVQYIQGCLFETNSAGQIKMATREFWGRNYRPFKHVGWELDSASDRDPIYWSNPMAGFDELRGIEITRNSGYSYANPFLTENWGSWASKVSNLKENKIFVEDLPTSSAWDIDEQTMKVSARISSLKFKVCLHRIEDVPARLDSPATNVDGALVCMGWDSNYNYNFATRKFEDKQEEIHSACRQ